MKRRRLGRKTGRTLRGLLPARADSTNEQPPPLPPRHGSALPPRIPGDPRPQSALPWIILAVVTAGMLFLMLAAVMAIGASVMVPAIVRSRNAAHQTACQNNLKQMGLIFKMYAVEHEGLFPALSGEPARFFFDPKEVHPEYLSDPLVLVCPGDPCYDWSADCSAALEQPSYFYFGYVVTNEEEANAFLDVWREKVVTGGSFEEDLGAPKGRGSAGRNTFYRLRDGVMRHPVKDAEDARSYAESAIPVMFDRSPSNHMLGGINVLYMDGHVEFVPLGSKFPALDSFLERLQAAESQYETPQTP